MIKTMTATVAVVVLAALRTGNIPQQVDCPSAADFAGTPVLEARISKRNREDLWSRVSGRVAAWRQANFAHDASTRDVLLKIEGTTAHTCYQVRKEGRKELRIAVLVDLTVAPGLPDSATVRVRWIAGYKGSGERTWFRSDDVGRALANDLFIRLSAQDDGKGGEKE